LIGVINPRALTVLIQANRCLSAVASPAANLSPWVDELGAAALRVIIEFHASLLNCEGVVGLEVTVAACCDLSIYDNVLATAVECPRERVGQSLAEGQRNAACAVLEVLAINNLIEA